MVSTYDISNKSFLWISSLTRVSLTFWYKINTLTDHFQYHQLHASFISQFSIKQIDKWFLEPVKLLYPVPLPWIGHRYSESSDVIGANLPRHWFLPSPVQFGNCILQEDWLGTKISATILSSLWVYLSLAPQDVTAPELQEVSLYQFILI